MEVLSWSVLTFVGVVVLFIVLGSFFTVQTAQVAIITRV